MATIHRLVIILVLVKSVNPQCYQKPTLVNPYSVGTLNEGQSSMKEIACFQCLCNGEEMQHYVIDLVRVNFPTYCRGCFTILNTTNPLPNSKPNFCLFFIPGATPVTYRRGPVFDITVRCVVENTATTTIPTTTTTTQTTTTQTTTTQTTATLTTVVTVAPTSVDTATSPSQDTGTTVDVTTDTGATTSVGTTDTGATTSAGTTDTGATTSIGTTDTGATTSAGTTDTGATTSSDTTGTATDSTVSDASTDTTVESTTMDTPTTADTPSTQAVTTGVTSANTAGSTADTATTAPPGTTSTAPPGTASTTPPGTASTATPGTASTATGSTAASSTATSVTTLPDSSTVVTTDTTTSASTTTTIPTTTTTTVPTTTSTTLPTTTTPRPQYLTAEGTIQVRVIANQPPYFVQPSVTISKNAVAVNDGGVVYKVDAIDPDGDPIFYTMTVDPLNSNFYIDGEGNIRAAKTLRSECSAASYAFQVTATDNKHDAVGPHLVTVHLTGTSTAPTAKNLNQEFFYKEDIRVPTFITKWSVSSDTKKTVMKFKPTSARTLFRVVGTTIRTAAKMDHEKFPKINITFTFSNDNCESKYYLLITIGNVNDVPVLTPPEQSIKVDEGKVFAQPSYTITDSDFNDRHTFHFYRDRSRGYNIDPITGAISHPTGVIIDKTIEQDVTFEVAVTDENGPAISNKVLVKFLIQDINNHAPEFMVKSFTERVMSCSLPKRLDITLEVSDQDSSQNGNSDWSVIPISSGPLSVTPDGAVYQTTNVVPGETYFVEAYVRDHGLNPGPLTGTVPVTITLIGIPCTPAPSPAALATTPAASASGSGTGTGGGGSISISKTGSSSSSNSNSNSNSNTDTGTAGSAAAPATTDGSDDTAGIVLGVLFGLLLLAALAYLFWRFILPRFCPGAYDSLSYSLSNCSERCCPQKSNYVRPRGRPGDNYDFWRSEDYKTGNVTNRSNRPAPFQYY